MTYLNVLKAKAQNDDIEDKFHQEATVTVPQCYSCTHKNEGELTCAAFPDGIPTGIITNEVSHSEHVPGDHGVMFNPVEGASADPIPGQ